MKKLKVTIEFESAEQAAYAYMFLSRSTFEDFFEHTEPHLGHDVQTERAYRMIHGVREIERALDQAGVPSRIY